MRLVLLTNMPSLHQVQLGAHLAALLGEDNFRLVFAEPTSGAREEMGWVDEFSAPYILRPWQSESQAVETKHWIEQADVVVQGRYPMKQVKARILAGKLTFAYQERFWKRPFSWGRVIARLPRIYRRYWSVMKPNYHLLAAGAYVAPDLLTLGCFRRRAWKFGYFIDAAEPPKPRIGNSTLQLLWCARFSAVKRADDAVAILRALLARQIDCHLTMIGDGAHREEVMSAAESVSANLTFTGWQGGAEVAEKMQSADVLLMTSGFGEGWAMVVNEAQNAGCMVVANQNVGAAPWLIEHGDNGLLYDQDNIPQLADQLAQLDLSQIHALGQKGYTNHRDVWSAPIAAQRLVALSEKLLAGAPEQARRLFPNGPCSVA